MRLELYPQGQGSSNPRRHTKENLKLEATFDTLMQEKSTAQIGSGTCKAQLGFACQFETANVYDQALATHPFMDPGQVI